MSKTRSRLLTSTVLPLAVVATMGVVGPTFADEGGCCAAAEEGE